MGGFALNVTSFVPEPDSLVLLGVGFAALGITWRKAAWR